MLNQGLNTIATSDHFVAYIASNTNELVLLKKQQGNQDANLTVLGRLPAHKLSGVDKSTLTCVCFDDQQASMLYVGTSTGVIVKVNALEAKVSARSDMNRAIAIQQLSSIAAGKLLVLTENKMFEYDTAQDKITRSICHSQHKQANHELPRHFMLSKNKRMTLEVQQSGANAQSIFVRDLSQNKLTHKFDGHSERIERLMWLSDTVFVSQASHELLIWSVERPSGDALIEVVKPVKILDLQQKQTDVRGLAGHMVMQDAFAVSIAQKESAHVFMVRLKAAKSEKARIKKPEVALQLNSGSAKSSTEIFSISVVDDTRVELLVGNTYQLQRKQVELVEDVNGAITFKKNIVVGSESLKVKEESKKKGRSDQDVHQTGLNETEAISGIGAATQFNLFNMEQMEKRKSSNASTADMTVTGGIEGSLATILQQSLTSNDLEQSSWVLSQSDEPLIVQTLNQLKQDPKIVSQLLEQILIKLQSNDCNHLAVSTWLRCLLRESGAHIARQSRLVNSLAPLQALIKEKTANLSQLLQLKGKLDMIQSMQLAVSSQAKYAKIKTNVKSERKKVDDDVIMFKDYRDEDAMEKPAAYQEVDESDDASAGYGDEDGEDDYDEEISAADIKEKKKKTPAGEHDKLSQGFDDYGEDRDMDDDDEDEDKMRARLVAESDDEAALQADDKDSDVMSDL